MKRPLGWLASIAISLTLVFASSCKDTQDALGLGVRIRIEKTELSNGLTVILVPDKTVPVVAYQTWFRVGSVDERRGITGISHLFEHLMFKGTEKYGAKQFFEQLEAKGAEVNAFTTRDYTVYHETFTPNLLEKVIDMESDRLANIKFDKAALETERQVVFEERGLRTENSPSGKMQEAIWQLAFERHPYGWPVIGYPEDLVRIDVKDLNAYFNKHYAPSNAAIVVAGAIDPDKTLSLIKKYYGKLTDRPRPKREIPREREQNEEHRFVIHDHVASEQFIHAYHVTSADEDDSYALDVLANILFEGTSSRAHRLMVEEKDVVVGVSGYAFTPSYPGLFFMSATMKGDLNAEEAEKLLDRLINEAQEKEVSKEEITTAVKQLSVELVDSIRTPHGLAQMIGTVQTIFGDLERFPQEVAKYEKVTAADVKRVARKYLVPNNRSVVTLLPESRKAASGKGQK